MDLAKLVEWIKLAPRYLLAVAIVCALLLFSPEAFAAALGLSAFRDTYRPWIGVVFLLSLSLVTTHLLVLAFSFSQKLVNSHRALGRARQRLHNLTPAEKQILRKYINRQSRTNTFPLDDGLVRELEALHILQRASSIGDPIDGFPYNIQPWAWDYLNKHNDLIDK